MSRSLRHWMCRISVIVPLVASVVLMAGASTPAFADQVGPRECRSGHIGQVCITIHSNNQGKVTGYDAAFTSYIHTSPFPADFNLWTPNTTFGDFGAFNAYGGQTYTFFFNVGNQGCAQVIVHDRSGQWPSQGSPVVTTPGEGVACFEAPNG
jgi:hypothetical protein